LPSELTERDADAQPGVGSLAVDLFDTLPPDHYKTVYLPGAVNACVFEVTFLDQMASITRDKQAEIVLYGANERSMEASVAMEKLNREGFSNVHYGVDTEQSVIEWAGRNPNTKHDGTPRIAHGEIQEKDGHATGTFEIDMAAIENKSLAGDELQPVLIAHLQSDDFFYTKRFPKATFSIREAHLRDDPYVGAPTLDVEGDSFCF
jgi:hypothetical protein